MSCLFLTCFSNSAAVGFDSYDYDAPDHGDDVYANEYEVSVTEFVILESE